MANIRLFTHQALTAGSHILLEPEPAHHLCHVLRAKKGDSLVLFNGDGLDYPATLIGTGKKTTVEILQPRANQAESPLNIHLLQGVCRSDRMDYALQKSVEVGVSSISAFLSEKSQVKIAANRADKKLKHWQAIIQSACAQCGRSTLPSLHFYTNLQSTLVAHQEQLQNASIMNSPKILLSPDADSSLAKLEIPDACCSVLVGPESGFTDRETLLARDSGYTGISLGPRILRTETAGPVVVGILQAKYGDLAI